MPAPAIIRFKICPKELMQPDTPATSCSVPVLTKEPPASNLVRAKKTFEKLKQDSDFVKSVKSVVATLSVPPLLIFVGYISEWVQRYLHPEYPPVSFIFSILLGLMVGIILMFVLVFSFAFLGDVLFDPAADIIKKIRSTAKEP